MRLWLAARIPMLRPVEIISEDDLKKITRNPRVHLWLVLCDAALGLLWPHVVPYVTISARTAHALLSAPMGYVSAPLWALILGAALETPGVFPFLSYRGHLQDALKADAARQVQGLQMTAPDLVERIMK